MNIFNRKFSVKTTLDNYYCFWISRIDYHVIYIIEVLNEMEKKDISIFSTSIHVQLGLSALRTGDKTWWYSDICRFYFPNSKWNCLSFKTGSNMFISIAHFSARFKILMKFKIFLTTRTQLIKLWMIGCNFTHMRKKLAWLYHFSKREGLGH